MKTCTRCKIPKEDSCFRRQKLKNSYGLRSHCRDCARLDKNEWKARTYLSEPEVMKRIKTGKFRALGQSPIISNMVMRKTGWMPEDSTWFQRLYQLQHDINTIDKCIACGDINKKFMEYKMEYNDFCGNTCFKKHNKIRKDIIKKEWYRKNAERLINKSSKRQQENHEEFIKYQKKHYVANREKLIKQNVEWQRSNPDKVKEIHKNYRKRHPEVMAWRSVLGNFLTRMKLNKIDRTHKMLGYSAAELKEHLNKLLKPGMSWDNYGKWHVDHKFAVTNFLPDTPCHIVNGLPNLQPLWAGENMSKGNKII